MNSRQWPRNHVPPSRRQQHLLTGRGDHRILCYRRDLRLAAVGVYPTDHRSRVQQELESWFGVLSLVGGRRLLVLRLDQLLFRIETISSHHPLVTMRRGGKITLLDTTTVAESYTLPKTAIIHPVWLPQSRSQPMNPLPLPPIPTPNNHPTPNTTVSALPSNAQINPPPNPSTSPQHPLPRPHHPHQHPQ